MTEWSRLDDWMVPDWPAPPSVRTLITTRQGGFSAGPYESFNLGDHVGDDPQAVARNRALLRQHLPADPVWLTQVHGTQVASLMGPMPPPEADAAVTRTPGTVCAVLTADCLPVLLCDGEGTVVGISHAGWRGLAAGVVERTLEAMAVPPSSIMAYFGPGIGPRAFMVGGEVREVFMKFLPEAEHAFTPASGNKWLADLYALATQRLRAAGVIHIHGGGWCTFEDSRHFYSYRRDGITGRMASLIWLEPRNRPLAR